MRPIDNELIEAARVGDLDAVRAALDRGADINTKDDSFSQTALHIAASEGFVEVVEHLMERGADLLLADAVDMTPLHLATRDGRTRVVTSLLSHMDTISDRVMSDIIHVANMSSTGNQQIVHMLVKHRIKIVSPSVDSLSDADAKLHKGAHGGDVSEVLSAIEEGADLDVFDGRGMRPLVWAALRGKIDVVNLLLEKGADVNAANTGGWTPLMHASAQGHLDIVTLLLDNGADVNMRTEVSGTALIFAAGEGFLEVVKLLLENNADPTVAIDGSEDEDGMTALEYADRSCHTSVVELLKSILGDEIKPKSKGLHQ